jgi:monovalent cation:H+ antiporter-2, CPA2 family
MTEPHLIDVIAMGMLFFGIAGILVPLLQRLHVSPVLSYLLCGIVIGPYGIAQLSYLQPWVSHVTITETGTVHLLGELGIVTLMFMIGLELSLGRLNALRRYIFGLGSVQIGLTALVIFGIALLFENSMQGSVLLGASFALSSTAIVMKLLEEQKLSNRPIGILCFSVLLMQDLAVVPILVLAASFAGDATGSVFSALGTALLLGVATVVGIYLVGKKVLTPLFKSISFSSTAEWLLAFVVFVVLAIAVLTYAAGLSLALGAFMAGLLISETEFKHEVEVVINPLKGLLLGIFFLSVGMMVNYESVFQYPVALLLSVVGLYSLKGSIIFGICLAFRVPGRQAAEAAVYLSQPGEFALMILGIAMASQLMPVQDIQFFLLVTVLAMMLTPFVFKLAPFLGQYGHRFFGKDEDLGLFPVMLRDEKSVVIAGFGRVGQMIGHVLAGQGIPYIAVDHDGEHVQKLRQHHVNVIYGDARKKELWQHLICENIQVAVIAIDDHHATAPILKSLRAQFPLLTVIVRSRDSRDCKLLYDAGASYVVEETLELSMRISQILMTSLDISPEDAKTTIDKSREAFV